MFPIGDSPNPRGIAWVTYGLIAINVLVYVMVMPMMSQPLDPSDPQGQAYLQTVKDEMGLSNEQLRQQAAHMTAYDAFVYEHGSRPNDPSFLDMLKSMFLHGGLMHLFGNMLFLWIYGNNTEHRLGRIYFLLAYLATGFVAAWGDMILRPGSGIPAVGASGAISGVLGMYFIWFPHNKVRLIVLIPGMLRPFDLPARWVLGFYIVAQNILPAVLSSGGPGGGVAHGAHIGGFIAGLLVAIGDNALGRVLPGRKARIEAGKAELAAAGEGTAASGGDAHLEAFREAVRSGESRRAASIYFSSPRALVKAGLRPEELVELAQELRRIGESRAALAVYQHAMRLGAKGPTRSAAHLGAAQLALEPFDQPTVAYQHVYDAVQGDVDPEQEQEAHELLERVKGRVRSVPLEAERW